MFGEDFQTLLDMTLDAFPFRAGEGAPFVEDIPRYPAFPDIMEKKADDGFSKIVFVIVSENLPCEADTENTHVDAVIVNTEIESGHSDKILERYIVAEYKFEHGEDDGTVPLQYFSLRLFEEMIRDVYDGLIRHLRSFWRGYIYIGQNAWEMGFNILPVPVLIPAVDIEVFDLAVVDFIENALLNMFPSGAI